MKNDLSVIEKLDELWPQTQSRHDHDAVSNNTRRAYRSDMAHFLAWGGFIPSSTEEVIDYLETYAVALSIRTLRRRVAALNEAHRLLGVSSPADRNEVRRVLRGIAAREGKPPKKAQPLLLYQARDLILKLDGSMSGVRDKALILLGWALFLRRSEIVALNYEQIVFMPDHILTHLGRSITDQENVGLTLTVPRLDGPACPVAALELWIRVSEITEGPIFRRVFKGGSIGSSHQRLTPSSVNLILKRRAREAGVSNGQLFSGHSLRRGGITESYACKVPEEAIQQLSRHKSLSQLRDYRQEAGVVAGDQPSQAFLSQLNALLSPGANT